MTDKMAPTIYVYETKQLITCVIKWDNACPVQYSMNLSINRPQDELHNKKNTPHESQYFLYVYYFKTYDLYTCLSGLAFLAVL
jgi:hypothetical protein